MNHFLLGFKIVYLTVKFRGGGALLGGELEHARPLDLLAAQEVAQLFEFFFPFTGEANLNVHSPAVYLPSTIVHELAHLRGIASEQECNFLAVLASTTSGNPAYAYAGWLMGYIHLGNALYRVDPDTYWAIRETLPETVKADLNYNNAYWRQFQDTVVQTVSNKIYDTSLKAYGDERGMQSYGMVVDLLVVYYKDFAQK